MARPLAQVLPAAAVALLAIGGLAFSFVARGRAVEARAEAEAATRNLAMLQDWEPSLVPAVLAAAKADRDALAARTAAFEASLQAGAAAAIPDRAPFTSGTDFFFDLVKGLEEVRSQASASGVKIAPAANDLGFASVIAAGTGPEGVTLDPIYRQRLALGYLLGALVAAGPDTLLAVRREPVVGETVRQARPGAADAEHFTVPAAVTAAVPGVIETTGFQLEFTGRSAALRKFMVALAAFERPIVVRSVEVQPAVAPRAGANARGAAGGTGSAARPGASPFDLFGFGQQPAAGAAGTQAGEAPAAIPLVKDNLARFTVTLELFRVLPPATTEAP